MSGVLFLVRDIFLTDYYSLFLYIPPGQVKDLSDFTPLKGKDFVPTNPEALNTATFSDRRLFSGTMISDDPKNNFFAISSAKVNLEYYSRLIVNIPSKSRDQNLKVAMYKFLISYSLETVALFMPYDEEEISKVSRFVFIDTLKF